VFIVAKPAGAHNPPLPGDALECGESPPLFVSSRLVSLARSPNSATTRTKSATTRLLGLRPRLDLSEPNKAGVSDFFSFSVGATVYHDGASGRFLCLIPGIVVIDGHYTEGTNNADSGIATVWGVAIIYFPTFDPFLVEFTNTFTDGGPGVGAFTLSETSGFFPNYPTDVDTEVVVRGTINIR
jgi:hypothetical protein